MSQKQRRTLLSVLTVFSISAAALGLASARLSSGRNTIATPTLAQQGNKDRGQTVSAATRLKTLAVTLTSHGFEPENVEQQKGKFFLAVIDRTRIEGLALHLDKEVGGRVKDISIDSRVRRGAGVVDLTPGRYVLSEANHPDWLCHITVTPQ